MGEQEPIHHQQPERNERPISEMSFFAVSDVFEGYYSRLEGTQGQERGGFSIKKHPYFSKENPGGHHAYDKNYHSESSFSPEERVLVDASIARYNSIINGAVRGRPDIKLPNFSERIQTNIQSGINHVGLAVLRAHDGVIDDFAKYHPNLLPAFDVLMTEAGTAGFIVVLHRIKDFGEIVRTDTTNQMNTIIKEITQEKNFHGAHPLGSHSRFPAYKEYEVACMGIVPGRNMISHTADAIQKQVRKNRFSISMEKTFPNPLPRIDTIDERTRSIFVEKQIRTRIRNYLEQELRNAQIQSMNPAETEASQE